MNKKIRLRIALFSINIILLTSCNAGCNTRMFIVDNPLDTEIHIIIDQGDYLLAPRTSMNIRLAPGKHILNYDGDTLSFEVGKGSSDIIINPTQSSYIVYNETYIIGDTLANNNDDNNATLYHYDMEGQRVKISFKVIASVFLEQSKHNWQLGLEHTLSKKQWKEYTKDTENIPKAKIFRGDDFLDYLGRENIPANFAFLRSTSGFHDLHTKQDVEEGED